MYKRRHLPADAKAMLIAPDATALLILATMVAWRGGFGAVTVMIYLTLILFLEKNIIFTNPVHHIYRMRFTEEHL